ncbi:hypothetical protein NWT09_31140 [Mycolicibacterium sp. jd]|uniref:hypothetical protein n=1 Tax=unclassified Mycolicibacterium TaxID=2636767 RepID=UPI00351BD213
MRVQEFDFGKDQYSRGLSGDWAAGEQRGALLHDSKGAGLFRLLLDVLGGRAANLPLPGSLAKLQDPERLRQQAAQAQRATAEAQRASAEAAKSSRKMSAEWSKDKARQARGRQFDRVFDALVDALVGAFKGGVVGLVLWGTLAWAFEPAAGFGVAVVIGAAVIGAMLE